MSRSRSNSFIIRPDATDCKWVGIQCNSTLDQCLVRFSIHGIRIWSHLPEDSLDSKWYKNGKSSNGRTAGIRTQITWNPSGVGACGSRTWQNIPFLIYNVHGGLPDVAVGSNKPFSSKDFRRVYEPDFFKLLNCLLNFHLDVVAFKPGSPCTWNIQFKFLQHLAFLCLINILHTPSYVCFELPVSIQIL